MNFERHQIGNLECNECTITPSKCACGGVIHFDEEEHYNQDEEPYTELISECDKCGKESE